jgi:hypothetical protein
LEAARSPEQRADFKHPRRHAVVEPAEPQKDRRGRRIYTHAALADGKEQYALATYGRKVA